MKRPAQPNAFALVLVLITIVLAAAMAVFFLSSAGRERRGVDMYARSSEVRHLAGMTVNKVMGQISTATKEGTAADPVSWASQPGMVRTYGQDGNPKNIYKLYSWDNLLSPGSGFDPFATTEVPPSGWNADVAVYTDLNQRINDIYPIVDPRAQGTVEGFKINEKDPAVQALQDVTPDDAPVAPMPVKWLYVLRDGQMVAPSDGSGKMATVPGATADNPITGRIAFWTDDETSKVNLNTASEGAYWDWPKAATFDEMQFAGNPPVAGEFNRTPGHPGMTSLSAVFPELDPGDRWGASDFWTRTSTLLSLSPRVPFSDNSSRGGTYPVQTKNFVYGPSGTLPAIPNTALTLKADRLMVSPDEVRFVWPARSLQPSVTTAMVQEREFFLTTQSRAPETTLFETPRISLWPITWPYPTAHATLANRQIAPSASLNPESTLLANNTWMRAEERLLAFTSSLNRSRASTASDDGDRYFFQRQNSESPTHDYTQIGRNRELLAYLQKMTGDDIPGYGDTSANRLTTLERDALLANAFNVSRSLVNQYTLDVDGRLLYSYTPVSFAKFKNLAGGVNTYYNESGAFSPIPLKLNLGTGDIVTLSEFPLLKEAALMFYATDRVTPGAPNTTGMPDDQRNQVLANPWNWTNLINLDPADGYPDGAQTTKMRALLILDFSPVRGSTRNNQPVFWVKVSGTAMQANVQNLNFGSATAKMDFRAGVAPTWMLSMYKRDTAGLINGIKTFNNGDVSDMNYGLISSPITVSPNSINFPFLGSELTVQIFGIKNGDPNVDPTSDSSLLVATYQVDFRSWPQDQPMPIAPYWSFLELVKNASDPSPGFNPKPIFPNPNFKTGYTKGTPTPKETRETKWAAIEIAPPYRSGTATADPAVTASPATVWGFSSLYGQTDPRDGSLSTHAMGSLWGYPALYARARKPRTGEPPASEMPLMMASDPTERMRFAASGLAPLAQDSMALNSGVSMVSNRDDVFGAGFPTITPYDTVLSVIVDPTATSSGSPTGNGDPRLALKAQFKNSNLVLAGSASLRQVLKDSEYPTQRPRQYHTLGLRRNTGFITRSTFAMLASNLAPSGMALLGGVNNQVLGDPGNTVNDIDAIGVVGAKLQSSIPASSSVGDWTSSPGIVADGGVLVRPDQDSQSLVPETQVSSFFKYQTPYFRITNSSGVPLGLDTQATIGYFSANRQLPSPVTLLGGLPSSQTVGWQTLAFSPNPAAGSSHPGLASASNKAPDHLMLDLFWMPIAEPYPISDEFATAGKINLNYQIAPFHYITRRTGLHALLKSTWLPALNDSLTEYYKSHYAMGDTFKPAPHAAPYSATPNRQTRFQLDVRETLNLFDSQVFDGGDIFRSASQLCEMWLVPQGSTATNVKAFWNDKHLTSDTAREAPYEQLYSRVTTKSNTYTVHWKAQVLRKSPNTAPEAWDESKDRMAAELRGSTLIERYIDPNATNIPDYATKADAEPLSAFYKWRVVSENYFQP